MYGLTKTQSSFYPGACGIVHPEDWLHRSSTKEPYKTYRDRLWEWRLSRLERSPHGLTQYGFRGQRMAVLSHFVSASRLGRIKALQIPLLVVVGMKDRLVKPSNSIYLARILDCDLFIFDNGISPCPLFANPCAERSPWDLAAVQRRGEPPVDYAPFIIPQA